jgi:hypothetical protein
MMIFRTFKVSHIGGPFLFFGGFMKDAGKILKVSCECKDTLRLDELTEFQGGLKSRTDEEIDKIVRSIKKHGFSFPFFVWKRDGVNNVLDGHGRLLALHKLDELGFLVPPLPVVYVDCKDEQAARDLLFKAQFPLRNDDQGIRS